MSWDAEDQADWREKMRGVVPAPAPRSGEPVTYPEAAPRFVDGPQLQSLLAAQRRKADRRDRPAAEGPFMQRPDVGPHPYKPITVGYGVICQVCGENENAAGHDADAWTPSEPEEVLTIFTLMLKKATGDGAAKRRSGEKPSWKVDPGHETAVFSHLHAWKNGDMRDKDSGAHPLVHAAWRLLAIAYQENGGLQHASKYKKPERHARNDSGNWSSQ